MNKETIELVKKMVEDGNLPQEIAENYCPEIKEIDDDRIRKAITAGVTKLFEEYSVFGHTTKEEVLAWVAKQEHIGWTKYDEQMYGELKIFIQCYQKDKKVKEEMLEWIKTLKPQLNKSTETNEQPVEWSEEDELRLNHIIQFLEDKDRWKDTERAFPIEEDVRWLKFLKERCVLQPKQEWSEEDYNEIETIACHLDNIGNEGMAKVLLNIRDKYYNSQSTWKPNQAEIDFLNMIAGCNNTSLNEPEKAELKRIIEEIKGL